MIDALHFPSRRTLLRGSLAACSLPFLPGNIMAATQTLKTAANRAGLHYGTCTQTDQSRDDDFDLSRLPDMAALVAQQCDLYAPNLNWGRSAPKRGDEMVRVDPAVPIVTAAGLKLSGYHLIWYESTPRWFAGLSRPEAAQALEVRYRAVASRFAPISFACNVVNEVLEPRDGLPGGLRHTVFLDQLGPDYIDMAFQLSAQMMPNVLRVINEYDLELATPEHEAKRTALLRLLDGMAQRNTPVQAVGLQSHLKSKNFAKFDQGVYRRFLHELASRQIKLLITELDVLEIMRADIPTRDQAVADMVSRFLPVALDEPAMVAVSTWGLSDRYTWLFRGNDASHARPDGLPTRPLPFDETGRSKPVFDAMIAAFNAAPRRALLPL